MSHGHDQDFVGPKLRLARTFHGLTQADAASRFGVTNVYISMLEAGRKVPSEPLLARICDEFGFERGFFFESERNEFRDDECHFRRRQTTPISVRNRVLAHGTLFAGAVELLDAELDLIPPGVPTYPADGPDDIESIAERCRVHWDLGRDLPIDNMMRVVENAGVAVTAFHAGTEKIDAFSRPGARDVIVLTTDKESGSRSVFDLAHELGHLVMHGGIETGTPDRENQANHFASAFLLPRTGFAREFPRYGRLDWQVLLGMKNRWRVSLQAMIRRAYGLRLIDAEKYQSAFRYVHSRGWHRAEPGEFVPDPPEMVALGFEQLRDACGISTAEAAATLHLRPQVFEQITGLSAQDSRDETPDAITHAPVQMLRARRQRPS